MLGAAGLAACGSSRWRRWPRPAPPRPEKRLLPAQPNCSPVVAGTGRHGRRTARSLCCRLQRRQRHGASQPEFQGTYVELLEKLIAGAAAGSLPDMILGGDGQYPPLARAGLLIALDDLLTGSVPIDIREYKEPVKRGIGDDGQMYQLAFGVSTPIYYVNVEMLDAAGLSGVPETWEQAFSEYFPQLAQGDASSFVYSVGNWWQQSAVWSAGAMVNDENWEVDLANPAVIEWFERMQSARQAGEAYVPTAADGSASAYFGSGVGDADRKHRPHRHRRRSDGR